MKSSNYTEMGMPKNRYAFIFSEEVK